MRAEMNPVNGSEEGRRTTLDGAPVDANAATEGGANAPKVQPAQWLHEVLCTEPCVDWSCPSLSRTPTCELSLLSIAIADSSHGWEPFTEALDIPRCAMAHGGMTAAAIPWTGSQAINSHRMKCRRRLLIQRI